MCEIIAGYNAGCDSVGGIKTIYGFNTTDATTTVANGAVTAISLTSGKYAHAFYVEMETAKFDVKAIGERANKALAYEHNGTFTLMGNSATDIVNLEALEKSRTTFIVELNDGTYEVYGLTNGMMVRGVRDTGQKYEDANGNTLTVSGKEKNRAYKISSALIASILSPTS